MTPDGSTPEPLTKELFESLRAYPIQLRKVYPRSVCLLNSLTYGLVGTPEGRKLFVHGEKSKVLGDSFNGKCFHQALSLKVCDLSPENTRCLMTLFPFTRPVSLRAFPVTVGTGDRLGVATPGHLRAVRKYKVRPVLAQQSVRENTNTGRNFASVVGDAAWGVFQEGYREGYGADGDHLKSLEQVKNALEAHVSMITLDLSEHLNPEVFVGSREAAGQKFSEHIDRGDAEVLLHLFLDKEFMFKGNEGTFTVRFDREKVERNTLLFQKAIEFTEEVYEFIRSWTGKQPLIDFEVSIDETPFATTPENHLFFVIASTHRGVRIDSLAPRFIGEFQKGIDYRGDLRGFRDQFYQHALIARDYGGYKISIHSGSDKFSIFPSAGELARRGIHLKTAGTSWLEAVRLVAQVHPSLYREMHQHALASFDEARKLYHVTTDLSRVPRLQDLSDRELPSLLDPDQEDSRQLLHITYGPLLNAKDGAGTYLFRDRFFQALAEYEEDYWSLLEQHIGKHLDALGAEKGEHS